MTPNRWDQTPYSISLSSSTESFLSHSSSSSLHKKLSTAGVLFNDSITVYPVFQACAYPEDMQLRLYTNHFELRENKIENKKEYGFDGYDWRKATEASNMEPNEKGYLVHPTHVRRVEMTSEKCEALVALWGMHDLHWHRCS